MPLQVYIAELQEERKKWQSHLSFRFLHHGEEVIMETKGILFAYFHIGDIV